MKSPTVSTVAHSSDSPPPTTLVTPNIPEYIANIPTIYIITPTYARTTQKVDLTSMCYTLMHVPKVTWILVEDSDHKSNLVKRLVNRCKVNIVHLNARTPIKFRAKPGMEKRTWSYSRGITQRNTGLKWLREHYTVDNANGVVYFGDDDNKYDLRLFEEVRFAVLI